MNYSGNEIFGLLNVPSAKGTDATVTTQVIPPWQGYPGNAPFIYNPSANANAIPKRFPEGITHLKKLVYTNGATAHVLSILRPLNYTWLTAAIASAGTVANVFDDPGLYSTNYKYAANTATFTAAVANSGIQANDWVVIQLNDGTWFSSKVASVATLAVTLSTAVPTVTGGGAALGAIVYFYGAPVNTNTKDPATGYAEVKATVTANATSGNQYAVFNDDGGLGFMSAFHHGDPLLFYDPGTTNLGTLDYITGYYSRY